MAGSKAPRERRPNGAVATFAEHPGRGAPLTGARRSGVEIHADHQAGQLAAAIGASAFTIGEHIVFAAGAYQPHTADGAQLLRHELAHVEQQRRVSPGRDAPTVGRPDDPFEHTADRPASSRRPIPSGRPPRIQRQPAPGPSMFDTSGLLFVSGADGATAIRLDGEGLAELLREAIDYRRRFERTAPIGGLLPQPLSIYEAISMRPPRVDVPELVRLGTREAWIQAWACYESVTGHDLLPSLKAALSEKEMGAALPYLRGVIPTRQLIELWSGTFSSDLPGVLRAIERMPDTEAAQLLGEFRLSLPIGGLSALTSTIQDVLTDRGDAYQALRALAARFRRFGSLTDPLVTPADRSAADQLARQLSVRAAFVRIREADRAGRSEWAYLAVADLDESGRRELVTTYLNGWSGRYLVGWKRARLDAFAGSYTDDSALVLATLEASDQETSQEGKEPSESDRKIAGGALARALHELAETVNDLTLPEDRRTQARERLASIGGDDRLIARILALPGGDRIVSQELRLPPSAIARQRALVATSSTQVVTALRGLAPVDVQSVLLSSDVAQHLTEANIQIDGDQLRVLDAYAAIQDAQPEPLTLPWAPPGMLVLPADPQFTMLRPDAAKVESQADPQLVVAGYEAFQRAAAKDIAGVVAVVRPLRPWQRAALLDDRYFQAAIAALRGMRNAAGPAVAEVLADPNRDFAEITNVLVEAGLEGGSSAGWDVQDERLLTEGLAVDPADRRLVRYRYILDELSSERGAAASSGPLRSAASWGLASFDLNLPDRLQRVYGDNQNAIARLDEVPRLHVQGTFLGEPDIMRADITPEEAALEAEFMRLRVKQHLAAAGRGLDASGVFGWSPETLSELSAEFERKWTALSTNSVWTRDSLSQLSAAYYDVMDAIDRNRTERNRAAEFIGNLAATAAGIVVIVATGGTATPLVVSMLAGAALGGEASVLVAGAFRDYTSPDQALTDLGHGAVTGALTVAGEVLAKPVAAIASARMAAFAAESAVNRAVAGGVTMAIEGAINGAVSGAGEAVFATAIDRHTWERGVTAIFARFLAAAAEGAFFGGAMGAVAAPVLGGAIVGAGKLAGRAAAFFDRIGVAAAEVRGPAVAGLEDVVAHAEAGRFDVALRRLDEVAAHLSVADREAITQELFRRALASTGEGAVIAPELISELDAARLKVRGLDAVSPAGGGRPGVAAIEEVLAGFEGKLGAPELAAARRILYGELRLTPAELVVRQSEFRAGLNTAIDDLLTPTERAALPPVEIRVLPPEGFSGMFRTTEGRAVTMVEGGNAVIYVQADADVRTFMLQEAAHLRQLTDPAFAADVHLLSEAKLLDWAAKPAEERFHLLGVQRRLEIDAQERIVATLRRDAPYAASAVPAEELDTATSRLEELRRHEAEAAKITAPQLAEMNAGARARPSWLDEEARLFGEQAGQKAPPVVSTAPARKVVPVKTTGLTKTQAAFQIGDEWLEHTPTTSAVKGRVTSVKRVGRATVVSVKPEGGGPLRRYTIESTTVDVVKGAPVTRGQRLGTETNRYRLIEVHEPGKAPVPYRETLNVNGIWVERGGDRVTRGTILEEALELQETARLRSQVAADAGKPTGLVEAFKVDLPAERRGFDRVFVEFTREGDKTVAQIRVIEVKEYPGTYVPYEEYTAITDNLDHNLATLESRLQTKIGALRASNQIELAEALESALADRRISVEVWRGPDTRIAQKETQSSVMAKLRKEVESREGLKMDINPHRVDPSWRDQATAANATRNNAATAPVP